ncbi:CRISPR-associated helicase Cas3' [Bordetella genomosp. 13]|uniref:CRISPR-associated helicase Cas3' n=1 Tax=Bordetella genomosp. 13 TaxID=463040 RepID=UPI00119D8A69|nr:CRISPR-associated helicase Cas3' [Bordetella genomosp. 13]
MDHIGIRAWGKRDDQGNEHPLEDHMLDVAMVFYVLIHIPALRRALNACAGRLLNDTDILRLTVLAFFHDVGKACAGFIAKRWKTGEIPKGWPTHTGHSGEAFFIFENADLLNQLPADEMDEWGSATFDLLLAAISHHGRPITRSPLGNALRTWAPVTTPTGIVYTPSATLNMLGQRARAWFPGAFIKDGDPLPTAARFTHLFAGLVQLADWLGSDTRFFPYTQPGEDRRQTAEKRARQAVSGIGLDMAIWRDALQSMPAFGQVFHVPSPRPMQEKMAQQDWDPLLIVESETGSGKTEAALWRYATLFRAGIVDALYFALPTRVAASQLCSRAENFAERLWMDSPACAPTVVRALAGYESADGARMHRLPEFKVLWTDNPDDQKAHLRWAAESAKRFLAAPIAVGTIDQALLAALQVRHAHLRHGLLARSLLVVDEVHASDAYMSAVLARVIDAHLRAGGHVLLLSATLGASARHRYQAIAANALGRRPAATTPSLEQASALAYPAISDASALHPMPAPTSHKTVNWRLQDDIDKPDSVAALAFHAAAQGAKVLVIRNTVPAAIATLSALEALVKASNQEALLFRVEGVSTVHHSRYSKEDRPRLDAAVERQLGKQRPSSQGIIVVGSQTLEQSLDIDADFLVCDLCPMDVLLQRLGRLHRHTRDIDERPAAYRQAQAIILTPEDGDLTPHLVQPRHGLGLFRNGGGIYTDLRIIEATRRLIASHPSCAIPRDNRHLVEHATHPEMLKRIALELGPAWEELGQRIEGIFQAESSFAKLQALPFDKNFSDEDFGFPDDDQRISTRLGTADRLQTFEPALPGPFGIAVAQLPIRFHLLPADLNPDAAAQDIQALPEGGFTFVLGGYHYRYARMGLERLSQPSVERRTQ